MNIEEYTIKKTVEHLVLFEDHLKEFVLDNNPFYCRSCLEEKHLPALKGYLRECEGVCSNWEVWQELANWLNKAEEDIKNLTKEKASELIKEGRNIRKKLSYLLMFKDNNIQHLREV